MSYPGYPNQGSNSQSSQHPHQPSLPYPANSPPYPSSGGVYAPSLNFNVDSPMHMPPAYPGTGYPSSTIGASYNLPYPPPSNHPSSHNLPYPSNQGQSHSHSSYANPFLPVYPSNQAYPQPSPYLSNPASHASNQSQAYPSPYQTQTHPSNNQGHSYPQTSPYPNIGGSNSSHTGGHGGHSNPTPVIKKSPTVVPASPFNPQEDAALLRKAMKGLGTDEKAIINVLTRRSNAQRLEITVQFKSLYGKDLIKELKSELSGNFEKLIVALVTPLPQYYAEELRDAISGLGTYEPVLIEILSSLTNTEMRTVREAYQRTYHKNLESDLKGDTSGHFKRLMVSLCTTGRDESMVTNPTAAAADAQALYKAGEKRVGTDESTFNMILCQRNHAQLRLIFQEYQKISGHDIEKAIKSEFSGFIEDGLLAIVRVVKNQQAFFATQFHKSITGFGTKDKDLIRLVVTRCEIDMGDIKRQYAANHKESLADAIKRDTSGDYRKCLMALIGHA